MKIRVIITLWVVALSVAIYSLLAAPALIVPPPDSQLTQVEINWTACPTSAEDVISETFWADSLSFGVAGTGRTVTLADKQGSPVTPINAVALSANQFTTITLPGARFQGGMRLTCSGAGVVYQFKGKVRR